MENVLITEHTSFGKIRVSRISGQAQFYGSDSFGSFREIIKY